MVDGWKLVAVFGDSAYHMHTSRIDATFQRKDASTENAGIPEHEALVTVLVKHSADLQPCLACICSLDEQTAWYSHARN